MKIEEKMWKTPVGKALYELQCPGSTEELRKLWGEDGEN